MKRFLVSHLVLLTLVAPGAAFGRGPFEPQGFGDACGTSPQRLVIAEARHQLFERRLGRKQGEDATIHPTAPAEALQIRKVGRIAVIDDDGTLVSPSNPFDLSSTALQFRRKPNGYLAAGSDAAMREDVGDRVTLGDDESVRIDLSFTIRFFGGRYEELWINSDGNVTFGEADTALGPRDLDRFLGGPPRIAPLFADLDPSQTSGQAGIFFADLGNGVQITWRDVPEFGTGNRNTVQLKIFRNGRIVLTYGTIEAASGIVGISPGGDQALLELVDYDADLPVPRQPPDVAIAERFSTDPEFDDLGAARVFLESFRDIYDHLAVFLDYDQPLPRGSFAYELNVRNEIRGIGLPISDLSDVFGSKGRLRSYLQMGTLSRYPADPDEMILPDSAFSTLEALAHEAGHRWLVRTAFLDHHGNRSLDLLGRQQAHWSFTMDTDASVMEGNDLRDNGDGTFTTVASADRYSFLDQYVMGLIPKESVEPFFYVDNASGRDPTARPEIGVTIAGDRVDLTVDDIIAAEGPRVPSSVDAPKSFKMAFVIVAPPGQPVSQASIEKVDLIRRRFIPFFSQATDGHGRVRTPLRVRR